MPNAAVWAYLPLQALMHAVILWPLGVIGSWLLAAPYFEGGLQSMGILIAPAIAATGTGIVSLLLGIPFRLNARLRGWYVTHGSVFVIGAAVGAVVTALAFTVGTAGLHDFPARDFEVPYPASTVYQPDWWILAAGWMLLSFFLLHVWRPLSWRSAEDQAAIREIVRLELAKRRG